MIAAIGTLLPISWTLCLTVSVLRTLKSGPDRALALPTPFMLLQVLHARLEAAAPFPIGLLAYAALLVLLYGCWQQKRNVARWGAIACGGAVFTTQLLSALL